MAYPPHSTLIAQDILALQRSLQTSRERRLVVLSGSLNWAQDCLQHYVKLSASHNILVVSDQSLQIDAPCLNSRDVKQKLGQETQHLIWNGQTGINPNALGAASGLVKGGGLLILLLAPLNSLILQPDPDYLRMVSFESDLPRCHTYFLKRIAGFIKQHQASVLFEERADSEHYLSPLPKQDMLSSPAVFDPYQDQELAFSAIATVANGHRNRPLVITANRGRGKSSLLGIAAARLDRKVIITAPSKAATALAFQHFELTTKAGPQSSLTFVPPEELAASTELNADLIFVDEAAALPVPILSKILVAHSRIVFATTVHGYEGSGQGFSIRFGKILSQQRPEWKQIHLEHAIRWAENDPLEQFMFELLCLNTDLNMPDRSQAQDARTKLPHVTLRPVTQAELTTNEQLLRQVMSLLVIAHYQTSPSDLRMLLDHPDISLLLAYDGETVIGLLLYMHESLSDHPDLHADIVAGSRRLKGQMIPQSLAYFLGTTNSLQRRYQRVVRIAVHPKYFGQGLGTRLIRNLSQQTSETSDATVGVSYGFTPELHAFWLKNGFTTCRIGYQADSASGSPSLIALKSYGVQDSNIEASQDSFFIDHFRFGLSRYYRTLDWRLIESILREGRFQDLTNSLNDQNNLRQFCAGKRAEFDCLESLEKIMLARYPHALHLDESARALLIMRILQHRSWEECVKESGYSGKKEALRVLRSSLELVIK